MAFREYTLASGRMIHLGRDAVSNDDLVRAAAPTDTLLHTAAPGSPFCNVGTDASKAEVKEAAVVCAKYSQDWRNNKKDVVVNKFMRSDMDKSPKMKAGCWGVCKQETIKVKKVDILKSTEPKVPYK